MDFTFTTYENLLHALLLRGFSFMTYAQYVEAQIEVKAQVKPAQPQSQPSHHSPLTTHRSPLILLRHDVEARYPSALRMAQIQYKLGIKGSYYFRIFPKKDNESIIKQIAALGHEIGYHYDDLTACNGNHQKAIQRFQKNLAYLRQFAPVTTITMEGAPLSKYDNRDLWEKREMRYEETEVRDEKGQMNDAREMLTTHHSPLIAQISPSKYDNRDLWSSPPKLQPSSPPIFESLNQESLNYTHFSILAEPYFDLDFNQILYLTDTGRRWDGHRYNLRDKATKENPITNSDFLNRRYHSTNDIIEAVKRREVINKQQTTTNNEHQTTNTKQRTPNTKHQTPNNEHQTTNTKQRTTNTKQRTPNTKHQTTNNEQPFPQQAMLNFHPQRWNDKPLPWLKEFVWQNIKNQGKYVLLKLRR